MAETVISVENISKLYNLGIVSTGTLKNDIALRLAKIRGKEDEYYRIGEEKGDKLIWALNDVSFEVKKGEVLAVVGKNGAGKSTILKILSRVTEPTKGKVKIKGRIASLLEVGTGFHPELTGRENVFLNGAILGMTKQEIRSKFDEIVEFSGVSKYIDTPVKRYSSGMYVRLAFAVAAHLEPEILIVDEVLAVGDAEFQAKCLGKMKDVSGEGRTVLFVSHSMPAVKSLCSRAVLLKNGRMALEGNVSDIIDAYLNVGVTISDAGIIPEEASTYSLGQAKFKSLIMQNEANQPLNALYYNQKFRVELIVEVREAIENAILDFSIGGFEGRYSYTSSFDIHKKVMSLKKGTYVFRAFLDPKLLPGNYSFYLSIHDMADGGKTIDMVERIRNFQVLPITGSTEQRFPLDVSLGKLRLDAEWEVKHFN